MGDGLRIGELARRTGCKIETIRYYELEGLLQAPRRSEGNYRLYGEQDARRLLFIKCCRSLDMTLSEIRTLLRFRDTPDEDCKGVNELLDSHIHHVEKRIEDLRLLAQELRVLRLRRSQPRKSGECGILTELTNVGSENESATGLASHVRGSHFRGRRQRKASG